MWSNLPFDLLSNIFFFLSPDSFACANATCRNWHQACASTLKNPFLLQKQLHPPWFVALPLRNNSLSCYAHNPTNTNNNWYQLSLDFLPHPTRLLAHLEGLLLVRPSISTVLQLGLCNPFTRQYKLLPMLNIKRTNPAVGVISLSLPAAFGTESFPCFKVYVAGGMSEAPRGGATYEPTLEMYDPQLNAWRIVGTMPMEFAVRLTVWTPKESVYCDGVLYWMTSARAYSLMGYDISRNSWRELSVPMADKLEFAVLVLRHGRLTLVGGTCALGGCIWELGEGESWVMVEKVPSELGRRFIGEKGSWDRTKCVGSDGGIYLYRDLWAGMVVWREVDNTRWEWVWIEGCESIRGKQVRNLQIKGVVVHPNLVPSSIF
ncbi:hypothetical protein ACLB2K_066594 [Fragaria x ananassa]